MSSIPLASTILSALFSILMISKKKKKVHDYILLSWLLLIGIHQLCYYVDFQGYAHKCQPLLIIGNYFPFLYSPILLLYVLSVAAKKKLKLKWHIWHFLPFIYFSIITLVFFYNNDGSYILEVYDGYLHKSKNLPYYLTYWQLMAASGGIYTLLSLWLLQKHQKNIKHEFSYYERINLNWLRYWIICSMICFCVIFILVTVGSFNLMQASDSFKLISVTLTINLVVISFFGFKQTSIFIEADYEIVQQEKKVVETVQLHRNEPDAFEKKYEKSGLTKEQAEEYKKTILSFMNDKKPYLENKLSLKQLASDLNISTNHLSQVINQQLKLSFFDFVNQYRVEEIKLKLSDDKYKHLTILALAYDCGFNSKSSFNSTFKKITGKTPSEFKNNLGFN